MKGFGRQLSLTDFFECESILMWSKLHMVSVSQNYIQRSSINEIIVSGLEFYEAPSSLKKSWMKTLIGEDLLLGSIWNSKSN